MPRATSSGASSKDRDANALKRNQACHQCRKRKLKCDAQRPCSTCVRSHAFAARSAHPAPIPPLECTFDDVPSVAPLLEHEDSQEKIERLEAKISNLQLLLQQANEKLAEQETVLLQRPLYPSGNSPDTLHPPTVHIDRSSVDSSYVNFQPTDLQGQEMLYPPPLGQLLPPGASPSTCHSPFITTPEHQSPSQPYTPIVIIGQETSGGTESSPNGGSSLDLLDLPLVHPAWPPLLPAPELLHHLVETFFSCHPLANRILHRGRTLTSLTYPPDSNEFPLPALLHAICAVASFYTSVIEQPHLPGFNELPPEQIFPGPMREAKPNASFGESHAHWATISAAKAIQNGERMVQVVQSTLILSWFHYSSGTSVNVWILVGKACRISGPLGISIANAYGPLSRYNRMPALVPPPKDNIDAEQRRNLFWLIYIAERFHMSGTCWPMLLDDEDISQYLPVTDNDFTSGHIPPERMRQRLASPGVLTHHIPELTDPFTLLTKAAVLLAKVKVFNTRYRTKYADNPAISDPRNTSEFQQLDELTKNFRSGWPREYRDPINQDGKVDPTLYLTCFIPICATAILHDPHTDMSSPTCPSSLRILEAVEIGMDLVYRLEATSFDVMLLDHSIAFCWTVLGAMLIRILAVKIRGGAYAEAITVKAQLDVIRLMLFRLGERTIIGRRQIKLLNEHFEVECRSGMSEQLDTFCAMTTAGGTPNDLRNTQVVNEMPNLGPNMAALTRNAGWLLGRAELVSNRFWTNYPPSVASLMQLVAGRQDGPVSSYL